MKREPTLVESLIPLAAVVVFFGVGFACLKLKAEILLVGAAVVAGLVARRLGYDYQEIQTGIVRAIGKGMPAMMIVIVVGALVGSWIASGTTPMLIYYGLDLISPKYFLVTSCVICSVVSVLTGTSYGTIGTMGVALIGIAGGLNIPLGQAAGAIVAGSYFGDKLSPFSDTTNLAPVAAGSNLFDHIRHMLWTTLPAWSLGLLVYLIVGICCHGGDESVSMEQLDAIKATLAKNFSFNVLLLVPVLITFYCAVRKKPVIPGLLLSALVAVVLAITVQSRANELAGSTEANHGFNYYCDVTTVAVNSTINGYKPDTGDESVDRLLARGGMLAMMHPTLIALCAFGFGGIMQAAGMLDTLLDHLLKFARTTGRLIASTVACSALTAAMTGNSYLSILVPGELLAPAYKKRNLAAKNLSRTTEDSGTVVVPLIPWSIAAAYIGGTLGVVAIDYAPWAVMCYAGMAFALFYGFTGIAIAPRIRDDETQPGS